jgi:hypothetical protein
MLAIYRSRARAGHTLRFAWHFLQMFVAMGIGMGVLALTLGLLGYQEAIRRVPEFYALVMAFAMVIPMAAWMRLGMGHDWSHTSEMSAAMTIPTLMLVVICSVGLLPHAVALAWSMPLMYVAMLGDMAYRWHHYA